jgi:hypothetical protein
MISLRESPWVCFSCGTERAGAEAVCGDPDVASGCGEARRFGARILHVGQAPYRTDPDRVSSSEHGGLWTCSGCAGMNKGAVGWRPVISCAHCGADREHVGS